jgi:hypothetical protein
MKGKRKGKRNTGGQKRGARMKGMGNRSEESRVKVGRL